jgi:hypothetical protein
MTGHRHSEWRFLLLTLFIVCWMFLGPLTHRWIVEAAMQVILLNSVFVTLWANPEWQRIKATMLALWLVSLGGSLLALAPLPSDWQRYAHSVALLSLLPLLVTLGVGILGYIFAGRKLTADTLFATIAVYLLIALLFAQLYLLLLVWNPASFNLAATTERPTDVVQSEMMYFSMITLATVGYGDILPVSATARTLATLEATVGTFYVAIIVAVFVGIYTAQRHE